MKQAKKEETKRITKKDRKEEVVLNHQTNSYLTGILISVIIILIANLMLKQCVSFYCQSLHHE